MPDSKVLQKRADVWVRTRQTEADLWVLIVSPAGK